MPSLTLNTIQKCRDKVKLCWLVCVQGKVQVNEKVRKKGKERKGNTMGEREIFDKEESKTEVELT